jgi:hypothetical protein
MDNPIELKIPYHTVMIRTESTNSKRLESQEQYAMRKAIGHIGIYCLIKKAPWYIRFLYHTQLFFEIIKNKFEALG